MKTGPLSIVASVLALAGLALSGCSTEPGRASTLTNVASDQLANEVFRAEHLSLIEYAKNTLQAECMTRRGYPQLTEAGVRRNPKPFSDMDVMTPRFATVSDDEARRLGFGEARPAQKAHVVSFDAGFDKAFDRCSADAGRALGPEFERARSRVFKLYNDIAEARDNALDTEPERAETRRASDSLLDCVDRKGFHPTGAGERHLDSYGIGRETGRLEGEDPPAPKRIKGTVEIIPAVPERRYTPTPEESALALVAAQCARETGFAEKIAAQRGRVMREVIAKHEDEIMELRPMMENLAKAAARVVGR